MFGASPRYSRLLGSSEELDSKVEQQYFNSELRAWRGPLLLLVTLCSVATTLIVAAILSFSFKISTASTGVAAILSTKSITTCGPTAAHAQAFGCKFDIMSFSWLPEECYDGKLVSSFLKLQDWEHFGSFNSTDKPIPYEVVMRGERSYHVRWEHHLNHCAFMWQKLHRALTRGGPVDEYVGNLAHTQHCGHTLVQEAALSDKSEVNALINLKFPECGVEKRWFAGQK